MFLLSDLKLSSLLTLISFFWQGLLESFMDSKMFEENLDYVSPNIEVDGKQTHCFPRGQSLSVLLYLSTQK